MGRNFSGRVSSEAADGAAPSRFEPRGNQAFVNRLDPAQMLPSDSTNTFVSSTPPEPSTKEESFDIEEWFNFEKFEQNYGGGNDESEAPSSNEAPNDAKVDAGPVDAAGTPVADVQPDHTPASETDSTAPFVDEYQSATNTTEQPTHMPQRFQFSIGQVLAPEMLTVAFQQMAEEAYGNAWMKSVTAQLDMLTCCMLATPDPRTASMRQCQVGATNLWTQLYHQKIHQLRQLQPVLTYQTLSGTVRAQLLHTLAVIHRFQFKPDAKASDGELARYQAQFHIELLRWEADEMADLSRTCDHYRIRRIQQSGINCRVVDGNFFDLANIINFRFQAEMSEAYH